MWVLGTFVGFVAGLMFARSQTPSEGQMFEDDEMLYDELRREVDFWKNVAHVRKVRTDKLRQKLRNRDE